MERAARAHAPAPTPPPACARRPAPLPPVANTPYAPRHPEASPLYRVLADHFESLERVHEERFESTHGPLRPVVRQAVGRFLDCGLLEHGFARVRCPECRAEFLVAFRCHGRQFCPSCHARRLAEWSLWLEERLLAAVPHRQVVLTVPTRLRAYFLYGPSAALAPEPGGLPDIAGRSARRPGEREAAPGAMVAIQSFGALVHWHPHLHVLVTDGAFRRDGTVPGRALAHAADSDADPEVRAEARAIHGRRREPGDTTAASPRFNSRGIRPITSGAGAPRAPS